MGQAAPLRAPAIGRPLPGVYIAMHCKLRDFLADQQRIATIKCDWLYKLCGPQGRAKMIADAGFTPVLPASSRSSLAIRPGA